MQKTYTYYLRPAYDSEELLLEFFPGGSEAQIREFVDILLKTLNDIHPAIKSVEDVWLNDEILLNITCDKGPVELFMDNWGYAFIMAKDNQDGIKYIDGMLNASTQFEKEEVDFEKYRNPKT